MCTPGKGTMPANTLEIVILPDGRIRYQTGSFAGAGHVSAAAFEQALLKELGVTVEERSSTAHTHVGTGAHVHVGGNTEHNHGHNH